MTKDNQRQGMAELLAMQREGHPLTPAEAAHQRRSRPDPGTAPEDQQAPAGQPAGAQPNLDLRFALSRAASSRTALLAAAAALAVSLLSWLAANQRRKASRPAPRRRWHRR